MLGMHKPPGWPSLDSDPPFWSLWDRRLDRQVPGDSNPLKNAQSTIPPMLVIPAKVDDAPWRAGIHAFRAKAHDTLSVDPGSTPG